MRNKILIIVALWASFCGSSLFANGLTRVVVSQGDDYVKVFAENNTKYIIKDNIDLGGKRVVIGAESVLVFKGGCVANGTIVGNNTRVKAGNYEIFKRGYTRYRAYINPEASKNYPPSLKKEYHEWLFIEGTWANKKCGTKWTGLLNKSDEDIMPAVKNYVALHNSGSKVILPSFEALGYEQTKFPGNHLIDFNNSVISYPDTLSTWEDETIAVPNGAMPCRMESGYGLITVNHNTAITNLTVDGKSSFRQDENLKLGVSNIICIGNSKNVTFKNVILKNVLGPGIVAHPESKDISFERCYFFNIGEHILYSEQYLGYCRFDNCTFDTWDSDRLSVFRNGVNYVYKHTPLAGVKDMYNEDLYKFDLSFNNCTFINPKRVNSQGRTLGGFFTGDYPAIVKVNNCKFIGSTVIFNPGGTDTVSEKTGKAYRLIVNGCDGSPCVYASKSNYNLVSEFYNCKNIPFRVVYAKRYENCKLILDLYENNLENITPSFKNEFSEPLIINNCEFIDSGNNVKINHPVFHRPITFNKCRFSSNAKRKDIYDLITVKVDGLQEISFKGCEIDLPNFRLVGGGNEVFKFTIQDCNVISIAEEVYNISSIEKNIKDSILN